MNLRTNFFRNKLQNMCGYKIKTVFFNKPSYMSSKTTAVKNEIYGIDFNFIQVTSKVLNFSISFVHNIATLTDVVKNLKISAINISPVMFLKASLYYEKNLLTGKAMTDGSMRMCGPILHVSDINNLLNSLIFLCSSAGTVFVIVLVMKMIKKSSINWSLFYVTQILFGSVVLNKPRTRIEKLIYLNLALVSIKYSSDTVAFLTERKIIIQNELLFDALKQLDNPTLPIYINKDYFDNETDNQDSKIIKLFKKNVHAIPAVSECFKLMAEKKDRRCLASIHYAKYFVDTLRNNYDKTPISKIIDPLLYNDFGVFGYE